jgi:hypothetical protein
MMIADIQKVKRHAARLAARGFDAVLSPIGDDIDVITPGGMDVRVFVDARGFVVNHEEVGSLPALEAWLNAH